MRIEQYIVGIPYPKHKVRGDIGAPARWSHEIVRQTSDLLRVHGPCKLEVEFVLPPDRFPVGYPYGTDLDNLLKRLLDALKLTVLSEAPGQDAAIVELRATKMRAGDGKTAGAKIVLTDIPFS